jgi:hypothetical protein
MLFKKKKKSLVFLVPGISCAPQITPINELIFCLAVLPFEFCITSKHKIEVLLISWNIVISFYLWVHY